MPSGENNLFYCVAVMFHMMLVEHRRGDGRYLEVTYGDFNWIEAINFILSHDGKGNGGILQDYLSRFT